MVYELSGDFNVAPLPGGEVALSDGSFISRVDATGRILARVLLGGMVGADPAGNLYTSYVESHTLSLDQLSPTSAR